MPSRASWENLPRRKRPSASAPSPRWWWNPQGWSWWSGQPDGKNDESKGSAGGDWVVGGGVFIPVFIRAFIYCTRGGSCVLLDNSSNCTHCIHRRHDPKANRLLWPRGVPANIFNDGLFYFRISYGRLAMGSGKCVFWDGHIPPISSFLF